MAQNPSAFGAYANNFAAFQAREQERWFWVIKEHNIRND